MQGIGGYMRRRAVIYLVCSFFLAIVVNLQGAWVNNVPNQLTQPDGTVIDLFYSGDEFHSWPHDADGYTMIIDDNTGYVCWAVANGGELRSTGRAVHLFTPQELGLSPRQNISAEIYRERRQQWDTPLRDTPTTRTPTVGTVQDLVIFIRFADDPEFTRRVAHYDSLFNEVGEGVNSLKQYYWDASYQQLTVESPFYPTPSGNNIVSYVDPQPRGYFQPYNAVTNPIGYTGGNNSNQRTQREHQMLKRAVDFIAPQVPTTLNIDSDNDGYVDNANFFIKGASGAWASLLWPHRWGLYTEVAMINGKRVMDYNFNMENHTATSGVSVLAHEFGHSLGAPDYYRYPNQGEPGTPVGTWDLMASDMNPPQSMSAYTKWYYMQWVPQIPLATTSGVYTLYPNSVNRLNHAIRVASPNSTTDYFVVEYRNKNTGLIDSTIAGSGLVVWRVNSSMSGQGNSNGPPDELYVFRQGGSPTSDGAVSMAFLSAESGNTEINDLTNPYTFLSNGQSGGLNIYNIGSAGETISFYLDLAGADPLDIDESFETQNFGSYDWQNDEANPWNITSVDAHNGNYSALSPTLTYGQKSRLEIDIVVNRGFFQFYGKTDTILNGDFLKLYINDTLMRQWSGVSNWFHYSIFLNTGTYHIAWVFEKSSQNTNGSDAVWIDQIGFPEITGSILYPAKNLTIQAEERNITLNWSPPFVTTVSNPPTFLGYNVYRNTVLLTPEPIPQTTFQYTTTGGFSQAYWVVAVYNSGVSTPTNVVNHSISYVIASNLQANVEPNGVRLNWEYNYPVTFVIGFRVVRNGVTINVPSEEGPTLTYFDSNIPTSGTYSYVIRVIYANPVGVSLASNEVTVEYVSDEDIVQPVLHTQLKNNYPNPFNPETVINFTLAADSPVRLGVYNIKGELVTTLVNRFLHKGEHKTIWNGKDSVGNTVSSGVYFYKMDTDGYSSVRKMVLVK